MADLAANEQRVGIAAWVAILAAIGSILATMARHPGWGLFIAIVAVLCGVAGFAMAASSKIRGGVISLVSVGLGLLGAIMAVIGIIGVTLF